MMRVRHASALAVILAMAFLRPAAAHSAPQTQSPQIQTAATATTAATAATAAAPIDTILDNRARALNMQLRCPVCQGSSIQESPSAEAQEMKAVVREKLEAGESEDQVKAYFVSKYGEWILLYPEAHGFNLMVYVLPVVLLLGGGAFVYFTARRWTATKPSSS